MWRPSRHNVVIVVTREEVDMRLYSSRTAAGAICATLLALAQSADASIGYTCQAMPNEDCSGEQDCGLLYDDPCDSNGQNCNFTVVCTAPVVTCNPQNATAVCGWNEVISTPTTVWRSYNGGTHAYTAQAVPPQGYTLEGTVFSLANDGYGGATEFPLTGGGPLYYYPASAAASDHDLIPVYDLYNPMYGDHLYTTDPGEASNFPCTPGYCAYSHGGICWYPVPPNCYYQQGGVYGYVGP
jgi:hypothetical protein